jgi:glutathionyl-hydroquinone reductase
MGLMVDGTWTDQWYDTGATEGKFERPATLFRSRVERGGSFEPEAGRYHLYVSWACPWAHRTLIYRKLKGLEDAIGVSYVDPLMLENGWTLAEGADPIHQARFLWQVYAKADPHYSGRVTVPVLWDRVRATMVNNESAEIIRMLDVWPGTKNPVLRPPELAAEIDALNEAIYPAINNGVYRAGFATTQTAYDDAYDQVFAMLDHLEARLKTRRFLLGDQPTEADWRLFTTLIRFDAVYYGHFKCNRARIAEFPELWDFTRALYQIPGVAETVRMDQIKTHYYGSHRMINPTGIIPKGPEIDFSAPTRRAVFTRG